MHEVRHDDDGTRSLCKISSTFHLCMTHRYTHTHIHTRARRRMLTPPPTRTTRTTRTLFAHIDDGHEFRTDGSASLVLYVPLPPADWSRCFYSHSVTERALVLLVMCHELGRPPNGPRVLGMLEYSLDGHHDALMHFIRHDFPDKAAHDARNYYHCNALL